MRVYKAETNKLKDIILQKIPLNFVILNWNTETLANTPSHIFPGVVFTRHDSRLVFFLYNLFANLKIIFSAEAKSQYILLSQIL